MKSTESEPSPQTLTSEQLVAIDLYEEQLLQMDNQQLRANCLAQYKQNLLMHNTYMNMLDYQAKMQKSYQNYPGDSNRC
jgi:hypothetical protein